MKARGWASTVLLVTLLAAHAFGADAVMKTESWANSDEAFAKFHERIARFRGRNLLARKETKAVDMGSLGYGQLKMLFDGSAGVRLGDGRVGINGHPAVLTFYLGGPRVISQVGVLTFNSDARTNQDFEVRFANNAAKPGQKPAFPDQPHLTTGPTILGPNTGGFLTYFRAPGGELFPGKADWVQFRIWRTYNEKAGAPAKDKNKAEGWSSVIEIEVLGDDKDVIDIPEDDLDRAQAMAQQALAKAYQKQATWQDTMVATREALMKPQAPPATDGFEPFVSPVLRGGQEPVRVKVKVSGLKRLWLEADIGGDTYDSDQAIWGDPVLLDKDGKATPLTTLKPEFVKVGYGNLVADKDHWDKPLQIAKRKFERGLWAHAPSQLCY
ncbi:MAG: hypothetical protein FJ272_15845, partial [Planctomycetes bacterium]|nr:hypothetical protein [Planctomycetota bacterium]